MSERNPGWLTAKTPKPRKAAPPNLGQDAFKNNGEAQPLPRATVEQQARLAQHAGCADHVKVEGLRQPVCVLPGQDPRKVAREARQLAGKR